MVTERPQLRQTRGGIEIIFRPRFDKSFIRKVLIEQQQVIVGSCSFFTVFATGEETEAGASVMAEPFKEVGEIGFYESISGWKIIIIISESNESRSIVETFFMHAPYGPLTGHFEFAAGTFATGDFDTDTCFGLSFFEDETVVPGITPGTISR